MGLETEFSHFVDLVTLDNKHFSISLHVPNKYSDFMYGEPTHKWFLLFNCSEASKDTVGNVVVVTFSG